MENIFVDEIKYPIIEENIDEAIFNEEPIEISEEISIESNVLFVGVGDLNSLLP